MLPANRPPTAPGEMLLEEFLKPSGITQAAIAERMGVSVQRVNALIHGKRGVTAETAVLLAKALGTSPQFWMGLQADVDLWRTLRKRGAGRVAQNTRVSLTARVPRRMSAKHGRAGATRRRA